MPKNMSQNSLMNIEFIWIIKMEGGILNLNKTVQFSQLLKVTFGIIVTRPKICAII